MSPAEFKAIRHKLGMTQTVLADRLGVQVLSINRWEQGKVPIAKVTALAMERLLLGQSIHLIGDDMYLKIQPL